MTRLGTIDWIALVLVIIGGLNTGLMGIFDFSLVDALFRGMFVLSRGIYVLIGLAALYLLIIIGRLGKKTSSSGT
jgi:uncharacterized membrane protein YuzA (DUF378 family)